MATVEWENDLGEGPLVIILNAGDVANFIEYGVLIVDVPEYRGKVAIVLGQTTFNIDNRDDVIKQCVVTNHKPFDDLSGPLMPTIERWAVDERLPSWSDSSISFSIKIGVTEMATEVIKHHYDE